MPSPRNDSGLSVRTLAIASAASLTAAIVVREVWGPGAIIGAAMTPVIVALVSESLNKPAERITTIAAVRRDRTRIHERGPQVTQLEPPPVVAEEDRFGIWSDAEPRRRRLDPKHVRIALATGAVAFAIVAIGLTASELVFGGSVTGGSKTTVFGGAKHGSASKSDDRTTSTSTTEDTSTGAEEAPAETSTEETPPAETTPTEPTETAPAETTPAPATTTPTVPQTTTTTPGGAEAPAG